MQQTESYLAQIEDEALRDKARQALAADQAQRSSIPAPATQESSSGSASSANSERRGGPGLEPLGSIFPRELDGLDPVEKGRILVEALWKPRGGVVIEDRPEEARTRCEACGTTDGWIYTNRADVHDQRFGKLEPCPVCLGPRLQAQALAQIFEDLGMPEEYRPLTLDSYTALSDADQIAAARVRELCDEGPQSAYLYGGTGVGKTFFAWTIVRSWIAAGATGVLVITEPDLLDHVRAGYNDHAERDAEEVFEAVKHAPILVLDDLASSKVTDWVVEKLFVLIDHRQKYHLPTIYTSNTTIDALALGPRTISRLKQHCMGNVIWVDGTDHRGAVAS